MKRLRHPRRLYSFLWYGLALAVIALAVLLTSARLLLPTMDGYRALVEELATDFIGQPVRIGGLDAELIGVSPAFIFEDVALLTGPDRTPLIQAGELRAELDLLGSLRQRQPVLRRLLIGGIDLTLARSADGALRLSGMGDPPAGSSEQRFDAWLLAQRNVVLRDSRFTWRDEASGRERRFHAVAIEALNRGDRHQLNATLLLPEAMGRRLQVALDLTGDPRQPETWEGELYVQAEGLQPREWLGERRVQGLQIDGGRADAALWSTWRSGSVVALDGRIAANEFSVSGEQGALDLDRTSAAVRWRRIGEGWRLDLADLHLRRNDREWDPGHVALMQADGAFRLAADFLRIEDVAAGLKLFPQLAGEQRRLLAELAPRGDLRRVRASLQADDYRLQADFRDLAIEARNSTPGVAGLDGELQLWPSAARLALNARDTAVDLPRLFRQPLQFSQLVGQLALERTPTGWLAQGRQLAALNDDIRSTLDLDLALPAGESPYIDLRGRFAEGRGEAVRHYLPVHIMPDATVAWLDNAFGAGRITGGTVLLRGRSSAFPFREGEGRFEVRFDAEAVDLAYQPEWPPLRDLAAEVVFEGAGMRIAGRNGRFFEGRIRSADVRIPDLRRARLVIDGKGELSAADVLRILRETPLAQRFGKTFQGSSAEGESGLLLHLEIPLRRDDPQPLVVRGELALVQATLRVNRYLYLSGLDGVLRFDRDGLEADRVTGRMFGAPVQIAVGKQDGVTRFTARGRASGESLRRALELPHLDRLTGEAAWQGQLTVPHRAGEMELRIESDLDGMAVALPSPLAKPAAGRRHFGLRHLLSGQNSGYTEVAYGDVLQAVFVLNEGGGALARGAFHFGAETPPLPTERGLRVTGNLVGVEPEAWGPLLRGGDGTGQPLPVRLALHRLQLKPDAAPVARVVERGGRSSPLPPLSLHIRNLELGPQRIGELMLESATVGTRTELTRLRLEGNHYALHGHGEWVPRGERGETRLQLKLSGRDIGAMMQELGFASVIRDGSTEVVGELSWAGTPADITLGSLNGKLNVLVEEGSIDELDLGGGRLLGLFSLTALPQRLRLDFSDVFKKGFTFQRIAGDLRFEQGQLFTDNLQTDASSARIVMSGRTGLATEDYDMLVTVVPNVSDSIAVAGGLAIGPQAGALLWILQKLFRIDEASMFQYTVEGPWEAPEITRLPRPDRGDREL